MELVPDAVEPEVEEVPTLVLVEVVLEVVVVVEVVVVIELELVAEVVLLVVVGSGTAGFGQVVSLHSSGQNSRILLKRYHCRLGERPDGMICSGSSVEVGHQSCFKILCSTSGESDFTFTKTDPLWLCEKRRWWNDLIPTSLFKCSGKKGLPVIDGDYHCAFC